MSFKIEELLGNINQILAIYNKNFIFDCHQNNGEYDDKNIQQLFSYLPQIITIKDNIIDFSIIEVKQWNESGLVLYIPNSIPLQLQNPINFFKQTTANNYNNLYDTYIHEFAHVIDAYIYHLNITDDDFCFYSVYKQYIETEIQNIPIITSIPNALQTYLTKEGYDVNKPQEQDINNYKYAGLLDILDALSNGVLYDNYHTNKKRDNTAVTNGHGITFKNDINYKVSEIFADYISMKVLYPQSTIELNKLYPNLVDAIEKTLEAMVND